MPHRETILFLGPGDSPLLTWLRKKGEDVIQTFDRIGPDMIDQHSITLLISYGYRHIIKREVLDKVLNCAINLHISLLPWNRGADPNLWSFAENTPKGVTIHHLDGGIDTGDIIVQREVTFNKAHETLATTYHRLHVEIQELFKQHWDEIKAGRSTRIKQTGEGSFHLSRDKASLAHLLRDGWDTPVSVLEEYAAESGASTRLRDE